MSSPTFELEHKIVRAGAGAGKTTQLTQNIYDVVINYKKMHDSWPRLVVTTFTRKATQELKERLIVKACDENNDQFLDYIDSGTNIHISTIHGVLNLFLRNYGHLLGWDNSFQVMSLKEARILAKTIIKDLDVNESWELWLENFSYVEMLDLLLGYYELNCTYPNAHPACRKFLENQIKDYCLAQQKELVDLGHFVAENFVGEKWSLFSETLLKAPSENILEYIKEVAGSKPRKTKDVDPEVDSIVKNRYDRVKKNLTKSGLSIDDAQRSADFFNSFKQIADDFVDRFLALKKELSKLEMQDLELISKKIIEAEPGLASAFADEWDYWLIDEYQDTSPLQETLLKPLIGESPCYIVGDPQQSIYLFRGARSEVFARKEQELKGKRDQLTKNYRSYSELLSFINEMFSGFSQNFLQMEPSDRYGEAQSDRLVAKFYNGDEQKFVCREILDLLNSGVSPENICVLARKNRSLVEMAYYLNNQNVPTHVHASGGFFQRREVMDVLSLVRFLVNTSDNENLMGLLRSPWLAVSDHQIIEWASQWKSYEKSFWQHLKEIHANVVPLLSEVLNASQEQGLLTTTEHYLKEWGAFNYSHYHDASGRRESNLWKLLTQWQEQEKKPGFNIYNFLNQTQVDLSESEGSEETDAVAALEPNCVNLMTIHASKGLQFAHVFIIEAGKAPQLSGGAKENGRIHLDEESLAWSFALPSSENSAKEKTILDHKYIEMINERELQESDRLFYVAVTRAVKNIYISWQENFHEQSWLGRSHFPLQLGEQQKLGYRYLYSNEDIGDEFVKWQIQKEKVADIKPLDIPVLESERLQKVSVTKFLEKFSVNELSQEFEPVKPAALYEGAKTAQLGSDIHELFEKARYMKNWKAEDYIQEHFSEVSQQPILKAYNWVDQLNNPPMSQLFSKGYVEWGFQWANKGAILEGQIDLWGEVDDTTWLIDYKSGSSRYTEKALQQLDLYAFPLYEMGYSNIQKAVIFPLEEKVIIDKALSRDELEAKYF